MIVDNGRPVVRVVCRTLGTTIVDMVQYFLKSYTACCTSTTLNVPSLLRRRGLFGTTQPRNEGQQPYLHHKVSDIGFELHTFGSFRTPPLASRAHFLSSATG